MMTNKCSLAVLSLLVISAPSLQAAGREEVQGISTRQMGLRVIEEKCLVCHNRQRIEKAVKERRDMERITRQMEKKGAALTDRDRQVIGHFWRQNPFRSKGEENSPSR